MRHRPAVQTASRTAPRTADARFGPTAQPLRSSQNAPLLAAGFGLAIGLALWGAGARAQSAELPPSDACLAQAIAQNTPAAACVAEAQQVCAQTDAGGEAAILCFTTAQEAWRDRIAQRMAAITAVGNDQISALAGIELRYDLQMNLLQCERVEALKLVTQERDLALQAERAHCDATAVGLSYAKIFVQSAGFLAAAETGAQAPAPGAPRSPGAPQSPSAPQSPEAPEAPLAPKAPTAPTAP